MKPNNGAEVRKLGIIAPNRQLTASRSVKRLFPELVRRSFFGGCGEG
ncbi:hypothetical protein [Paenibacillus sp. Root444D2]|nr:hypothetical protein [Paenibacillus sp. Root444D2]